MVPDGSVHVSSLSKHYMSVEATARFLAGSMGENDVSLCDPTKQPRFQSLSHRVERRVFACPAADATVYVLGEGTHTLGNRNDILVDQGGIDTIVAQFLRKELPVAMANVPQRRNVGVVQDAIQDGIAEKRSEAMSEIF